MDQLLKQLEYAFVKNPWYASLTGLLEKTTPAEAVWQPSQGGHSIYELVCHLAYANRLIATRLAGGALAWNDAEAWVTLPPFLSEGEWANVVSSLKRGHAALVDVLSGMTDAQLLDASANSTILETVTPLIQHEAFHAGQIAYIRRLQGQGPLI